jgi:Domain of unknown function (DUF222)
MLELVAGLDAAGLAAAQGFGNTGRLLAALLDCGTGQARARVREAEQLATRRTLTGEVLPARLPATAAALAAGEVGTGALQVIAQTMAHYHLRSVRTTATRSRRRWRSTPATSTPGNWA